MSRIDEALRRASGGDAALRDASEVREHHPVRRPEGSSSLERYPCESRGSVERGRLRDSRPTVERERPARVEFSASAHIAAPRTGGRGQLAPTNPGLEGKLVASGQTSRVAVEQYRRLAATLHGLQSERGLKILMITSTISEEGKTLTIANLALTLSESFKRSVLLSVAPRGLRSAEHDRIERRPAVRVGAVARARGLAVS
jgi:hypothetical protein